MTRFGILDDEPETCVSPTLQLLNRVSAAANVSSSMLGTSYLGNGTHSPAHLRRPPSSTPKRSLKPPALAQPQTTPGHSVKSKDKRDFVDTVRLLSSPLAAKESHALQDAAWKSTEHKAESMRLFFENMAVSNGAPPKPTMKNQADPFTVLESDIAGQRTALERTMNQKNSEIELKKKELLDKNAQMETETLEAVNKYKKQQEELARLEKEQRDREQKVKEEQEQKAKEAADAQKKKQEAHQAAEKMQAQKVQDALKIEKEQKSLAEKAAKEQEAAKAKTVIAADSGLHTVAGKIVTPKAWEVASAHLATIHRIKTEIKPKVMTTPPLTQKIFQGKMAITTRIGQFTHVQSKVIEIAKAISKILEDNRGTPEIYEFLMYLVAKQIVKQAEREVAVKRDMAFPIGIFCAMLLEKHKLFCDILLGKLIKRCPYIVPMYIKKGTSTDEEYRTNLGYIKKDDKVWESEIQYGERMCGIVALYAAIVQTTALPHSYGISNGWTWLSRILNTPPRRITPLLLHTFLEVAGFDLYKHYPKQMPKVMRVLIQDVMPRMPEAAVASVTRLQLFLEETVIKSGTIPMPSGKHLKKS